MKQRVLKFALLTSCLTLWLISCKSPSASDNKHNEGDGELKLSNFSDSLPVLFNNCKKAVFLLITESSSGVSQGSCFVITKGGIAISSYHIFEDASVAVAVNGSDQEFMITDILDYNEEEDYIIFQLGPSETDFDTVRIATGEARIGEQCFSIGNPDGLIQTLSDGIISGYRENKGLIQTTVSGTYGSSGGPLFNKRGEVIGITTQGSPEGNLNFAINIKTLNLAPYMAKKTIASVIESFKKAQIDIPDRLNSYYRCLETENFNDLYRMYADTLLRFHKLFNISRDLAVADHLSYLKKYKILEVEVDPGSIVSYRNQNGLNVFYKMSFSILRRSDNKKLDYSLSTIMIFDHEDQIVSVFDNIISRK